MKHHHTRVTDGPRRRWPGVMWLLITLTVVGVLTPDPTRAATISVSGDTLTYAAGAGEHNVVMLKRDEADYIFGDSGSTTPMTAGTGCVAADDETVRCSAAGIARLTVTLGDLG